MLEASGRVDAALAQYDAVITRWEDTENPVLASRLLLAEDRKRLLEGDG